MTPSPEPSDVLDRLPLRFLVGPTASGKSRLGLEIAEEIGAEIISLDSMSVYRGMDIGTAKPSGTERERVPHHLIDVADPRERFDLQTYVKLVRETLLDMEARGVLPLFVGGTGLYLAALLRGLMDGPEVDPVLRKRLQDRAEQEGTHALHEELLTLDPESAARLHPNDERRILRALEVREQTGRTMTEWQREWRLTEGQTSAREASARIEGMNVPVDELDQRIRARIEQMLDDGWPEEAERLEEHGGLGETAKQALGYGVALQLSRGEVERAAAVDEITLRTRQFARRQRTWFRKFDVRSPRSS